MGITREQFVERVRGRLQPTPGEGQPVGEVDDIEPLIEPAMRRLALMICGDSDRRNQLEKSYVVPLVNGQGTIPGSDILLESLPDTHASVPSSVLLQYLESEEELYYIPSGSDYVYWANVNFLVKTRNTDGSFTSLTAVSLTISNACYIPLVSTVANSTTLPVQLETMAVEEAVKMIYERFGPQAAQAGR